MITHIEFDANIDFPSFTTAEMRKRITLLNNITQGRKILEEKGAKKGQQWNFTANIKETCCSDGKVIANYKNEFSIIV